MNGFISGIFCLLLLLIALFLQTPSALFAIFYHSASAKTNHRRVDDLTLNYVLGAEIWHAVIFLCLYLILAGISVYFPDFLTIFPWLLFGIFLAESLAAFLWYYKPKTKSSTELFLSRKTVRNLVKKAESTKTLTDALLLGLLGNLFESPFTFPLYLALIYLSLAQNLPALALIALYIICSLASIFATHIYYKTDHNLADLQKLRLKLKPTVRLILTLSFFLLAILTLGLIYGL